MNKRFSPILRTSGMLVIFLVCLPLIGHAVSVEEFEKDLVMKQQTYNTAMSPAYVRNNISEETVNSQTGELNLVQTDYVLPGKNGLDLEIKRIYKSDAASLFETVLEYKNGAWVSRDQVNYESSTFYEDRYNLGIGSRFSFPAIERSGDYYYLHTESGDVYRLVENGSLYELADHELKDIQVLKKTTVITYDDSTSETAYFIMVDQRGRKYYFSSTNTQTGGRLLAIEDKYGNRILFQYTTHIIHIYDDNGECQETKEKKLISEITDTLNRKIFFTYRDGVLEETGNRSKLGADSEFSVTVTLPGEKTLKYIKTPFLKPNESSEQVIRTKLEQVYDTDQSLKYSFEYESNLNLKYEFQNETLLTRYNGAAHIKQINYAQYNRNKQFRYGMYVKKHGTNGIMQYRRVEAELDCEIHGNEEKVVKEKSYQYDGTPDGYRAVVDDSEVITNIYSFEGVVDEEHFKGDWRRTNEEGYYSNFSFRSNECGLYQTSTATLTFVPAASVELQFYYKILSQSDDESFVVKINGEEIFSAGGNTNWTPVEYTYQGGQAEQCTIEFEYRNMGSWDHSKNVCYIDELRIQGVCETFWENAANTEFEEREDLYVPFSSEEGSESNITDPGQWTIEYDASKKDYVLDGSDGVGTATYVVELNRPGNIQFYCKISDAYFLIYINNQQVFWAEGSIDWTQLSFELPIGTSEIRFESYYEMSYVAIDEIRIYENWYFYQTLAREGDKQYRYMYDAAHRLLEQDTTDPIIATRVIHDYGTGKILKGKDLYHHYMGFDSWAASGDSNYKSERYEYDAYGNLLSYTGPKKEQENGESQPTWNVDGIAYEEHTIIYRYSEKHHTEKDGTILNSSYFVPEEKHWKQNAETESKITWESDSYGDITKETKWIDDQLFLVTEYSYENHNLTGKKMFLSGSNGNPVSQYETPVYEYYERYEYSPTYSNAYMTKKEVYDPDETANVVTTQYEYDLNTGNVTKQTEASGNYETMQYDEQNRLMKHSIFQKDEQEAIYEIQYQYVNAPNQNRKIIYNDAEGYLWCKTFDSLGHIVELGRFLDAEETYVPLKKYEYNSFGALIRETDALGNFVAYRYVGDRKCGTEYYDSSGEKKETDSILYDNGQYVYDYGENSGISDPKLEFQFGEFDQNNEYEYRLSFDVCITELSDEDEAVKVAEIIGGLTGEFYYDIDQAGKWQHFELTGIPQSAVTIRLLPGEGTEGDICYRNLWFQKMESAETEVINPEMYPNFSKTSVGHFKYEKIPERITLIDGNGWHTIREYDVQGNLTDEYREMADHSYAHERFEYDYRGNQVLFVDGRGISTEYTYDLMDRLSGKITDEYLIASYFYNCLDRVVLKWVADTRSIQYIYDFAGRVSEEWYYDEFEPEQGKYYNRYEYDAAGNITKKDSGSIQNETTYVPAQQSDYVYDYAGNIIDEKQMIDTAFRFHKTYSYDHNGRLVRQVEYLDAIENTTEETAPTYVETLMNYQLTQNGEIATQTVRLMKDTEQKEIQIQKKHMDFNGNLIKEESVAENEVLTNLYEYDHQNRLITKTLPYRDNTTKTISYTYDGNNNLSSEIRSIGEEEAITQHVYDINNQRICTTNAQGGTKRWVYDECGNMVSTIDERYSELDIAQAKRTETEYDALNRPVKRYYVDGSSRILMEYFEYDDVGNIVLQADGEGYLKNDEAPDGTLFEYNFANQITKKSIRNGNTLLSWTYSNDSAGRLLSETDPLGNTTEYSYYLNGALKSKKDPDGTTQTYTYTSNWEDSDYDFTGRFKRVSKDRSGKKTTTLYGLSGNVQKIIYPDEKTEEYSYDSFGRCIQTKDRGGHLLYYEYYPDAAVAAQTQSFVSEDGNTYINQTRYQYDEAGNLVSQRTYYGQDMQSLAPANDQISYTYDLCFRLIKTEGPVGKETTYSYDAAGNLTEKQTKVTENESIIVRYEYDGACRKTREILLAESGDIADAADDSQWAQPGDPQGTKYLVTEYEYYHNSNVKKEKDAYGNYTLYVYDPVGNMVKKERYAADQTLLERITYQYDHAGNVTKETNGLNGETVYQYDSLQRLIRKTQTIDGQEASTLYEYDKNGNLIKEVLPENNAGTTAESLGTIHMYDTMNRKTATFQPYAQEDITVYKLVSGTLYDACGNIIKSTDGNNLDLNYTQSLSLEEVQAAISSAVGSEYRYDSMERLVETKTGIQQSGLATQTYTKKWIYNSLGQLWKETDSNNRTTEYLYYDDGNIWKIIQPDGGVIEYVYDLADRLIQQTVAQTDMLEADTFYDYTSFGQLRTKTDALGNTQSYVYDRGGRTKQYIDARGNTVFYEYDGAGRLSKTKSPSHEENGVTVYSQEEYTYDLAGNLSSYTKCGESSDQITTYLYDPSGLLLQKNHSGGSQVQYAYDKNGNVIQMKEKRSETLYDITQYGYNMNNRLSYTQQLAQADMLYTQSDEEEWVTLCTQYDYDVMGNVVKKYDPGYYGPQETAWTTVEYVTEYEYNNLGQVSKETSKLNEKDLITEYWYDEYGNVRVENSTHDGVCKLTVYEYDSMNRLVNRTDPQDASESSNVPQQPCALAYSDTNPLEEKTVAYTYDLAGNLLTETDRKGNTIQYSYDLLGRLTTTVDAMGVTVSQTVYDANGNETGVTDALGNTTTYQYDKANRLISYTDPETEKSAASYTYDLLGNLKTVTDGENNTTSYTYDSSGNLTSVTDGEGNVTGYTYDLMGSRTSMTDANGNVTQYEVGALGWLERLTDPEEREESYLYDCCGNMVRKVDKNGVSSTYKYDSLGNLLEKRIPTTGDFAYYSYGAWGELQFSYNNTMDWDILLLYDLAGRVTKVWYSPDEVIAEYSYDEVGNLTKQTVLGEDTYYEYDAANRMTAVKNADGATIAEYEYDSNGNRKKLTLGQITTEYTYDKANRVTSVVNKKASQQLSSFLYSYDDAGRVKSKTDSDVTESYEYDGAGRIKKVTEPGRITQYSYDSCGNRTQMTQSYTTPQDGGSRAYDLAETTYTYSDGNLLQKKQEKYTYLGIFVRGSVTDYYYDANGNQTAESTAALAPVSQEETTVNLYEENTQIDNSVNVVYNEYDGWNRLTETRIIQGEKQSISTYEYDTSDRRILRSVTKNGGTTETEYRYSGQYVAAEITGEVEKRYVRGQEYLMSDCAGNEEFYVYNGHGDVVQLLNAAGNTVENYAYDIFGAPVQEPETSTNAIRYAGEFYDVETGLYYLRARYYNPGIGRFITEDTYPGSGSDPNSLNRYTYCHNDPINYTDPTGHFPFGIFGGILGTLMGGGLGAALGTAVGGALDAATDTGSPAGNVLGFGSDISEYSSTYYHEHQLAWQQAEQESLSGGYGLTLSYFISGGNDSVERIQGAVVSYLANTAGTKEVMLEAEVVKWSEMESSSDRDYNDTGFSNFEEFFAYSLENPQDAQMILYRLNDEYPMFLNNVVLDYVSYQGGMKEGNPNIYQLIYTAPPGWSGVENNRNLNLNTWEEGAVYHSDRTMYDNYAFTLFDALNWMIQSGGYGNFALQTRVVRGLTANGEKNMTGIEIAAAGQRHIVGKFMDATILLQAAGVIGEDVKPQLYIGSTEDDGSNAKDIYLNIMSTPWLQGHTDIIGGIYYGKEDYDGNKKETAIKNMKEVSTFIHGEGKNLLWIPYTDNTRNAESIINDFAYLQDNSEKNPRPLFDVIIIQPGAFYYRDKYDNFQRIKNAIIEYMDQSEGSGTKVGFEMEFDMGVVTGRRIGQEKMTYLEKRQMLIAYLAMYDELKDLGIPVGVYSGGPNEQGYNDIRMNRNSHNSGNHIPYWEGIDESAYAYGVYYEHFADKYVGGNAIYDLNNYLYNGIWSPALTDSLWLDPR